ncbi:MAG: hypothetical protein WC891_07930 [Actinomycetota bacterium]
MKISKLQKRVRTISLIVASIIAAVVLILMAMNKTDAIETLFFTLFAFTAGFGLSYLFLFGYAMYDDLASRSDEELAGIDRRTWMGSILSTGGSFKYYKRVV